MKESFTLLAVFIFGAALQEAFAFSTESVGTLVEYVLYFLLFSVGLDIGQNLKSLFAVKPSYLFIPLSVIGGSLCGGLLVCTLTDSTDLSDCLAIASGFGYYSLSSIILTDLSGPFVGAVALMANIFREALVLCLAPVIIRRFGAHAYIAAAGATSMDTCLPQLMKRTSTAYVSAAVGSGIVLTVLVPILVTYFAQP